MKGTGTANQSGLLIAASEGAGGLWLDRKIRVFPRFEAKLFITVSECDDRQATSIDGIAAILSKTKDYAQGGIHTMGYNNIYDALVTEIDIGYSKDMGDQGGDKFCSMSIHKCFKQQCTALEGANTIQGKMPNVSFIANLFSNMFNVLKPSMILNWNTQLGLLRLPLVVL
jgi:hypothetical protein